MMKNNKKIFIDHLNNELQAARTDRFLFIIGNHIATLKKFSDISREANISRESLYRMVSAQGNPRLNNVIDILACLGLRLQIKDSTHKKKMFKSPIISLFEVIPLLKPYWDYEKNENVNSELVLLKSRKILDWKCLYCSNTWKESPYSIMARFKKSFLRSTSIKENSLEMLIKNICSSCCAVEESLHKV